VTPASPRCRLRIAGIAALAVGAADVAVLVLFSAADRRRADPVLLLAAVLCLVVVGQQARQVRRRSAASAASRRPASAGQAIGGPCDGQRLALPGGLPVPAELWLGTPDTPGSDQLYRYLLEQPAGSILHYRYAPPAD